MEKIRYRIFTAILALLLLASTVYVGWEVAAYAAGNKVKIGTEERRCVVIDAGHGGSQHRPKELFLQRQEITMFFKIAYPKVYIRF